jgi:hypothetical protein
MADLVRRKKMFEKEIYTTKTVLESSAYDLEGTGCLRAVGDKIYRWVKNASTTTAFAAGEVACHSVAVLASDAGLKEITVPATADLGFMAGIVASTTIAASSGTLPKIYGWVQVLGYYGTAAIAIQTATIAAGAKLIGADSVKTLTLGTTVGGAACIYPRGAILLASAPINTVASTNAVYVTCL